MIWLLPVGALAVASGAVAAGLEARQKARDAVLTLQQFQFVAPGLPAARAAQLLPYCLKAVDAFGLAERTALAAFLAQTSFESNHFRELREAEPRGVAYEPGTHVATVLGNSEPGDGVRFRGAGALHLTGRYNFTEVNRRLHQRFPTLAKVDLVAHPELAATDELAFLTAAAFWDWKGLAALSRSGTDSAFYAVCAVVQGDHSSDEKRLPYFRRAQSALGLLVSP